MPIVIKLEEMLLQKKMTVDHLAMYIGLHPSNVSILKTGKAKAIKVNTLMMLCRIFDCQPGDLIEYVYDENDPVSYHQLPNEIF